MNEAERKPNVSDLPWEQHRRQERAEDVARQERQLDLVERDVVTRERSMPSYFHLTEDQQAFRLREEAVMFAVRLHEGTGNIDRALTDADRIATYIRGGS